MQAHTSQRLIASAAVLGVLLLLASVPFLKSPFERHDLYGRAVELEAPHFSLLATDGRQVRLEDFRGRFVYLMLGYLSCSRICHSQALTLYLLSRRISDDRVAFVYIDMDPGKDTPDKIRQYFDARGPRFIGLAPSSMAQAQAIAADYHAYFSTEPTKDGADYRIDHPGLLYLIDPAGTIRAFYAGPHLSVERMLDDLKLLYSEYD